jgi:hypothetical protein
VPFLDDRLVEGVAALPTAALFGRRSKALLRGALGHRLPQKVLSHRKWGFGVPWVDYLRTDPELRAAFIKGAGRGKERREREPDPNSPFAKLAALKEQLEANAKGGRG